MCPIRLLKIMQYFKSIFLYPLKKQNSIKYIAIFLSC